MTTAFLLCGGLGTRLRGITDRPKALLDVAGWPFLRYHVEQLKAAPFSRIVYLTGYRGDEIEAAFGGERGTPQTFLREPEPRGTAGAIARAHSLVASWNWVANADSFVDVRPRALLAAATGDAGLVVCVRMADRSEYGGVEVADDGLITEFREKGESGEGWINAGVYLLPGAMLHELRVLDQDGSRTWSLEHDVFPRWSAEGRLRVFRARAFFRDIGTPARLSAAQEEFVPIRRKFEEGRLAS